MTIGAGKPNPLGATWDGKGANFAVFSESAAKIEICLFSPDGETETHRLALPERTGYVWHGYVPGLKPGALYGLRAHGAYAPERGLRFNPNKLLIDPYAKLLQGEFITDERLLAYDLRAPDLDMSFNAIDTAALIPKCVLTETPAPVDPAERPQTPWAETIIYEAHVKGLTQLMPGVPDALRGTYEALGSDAVIDYLQELGVTAIELLPIHAFCDNQTLADLGLRNYWGYDSIGFFAPEPRYMGPNGPAGLRDAIRRLHQAGIEVILDVVYNHTCEGDHRGPTLCFRGLDNASYYRLQAGQPRYYVNETGCGNGLNLAHPFVLRMVLDSLRWWVQSMGVDGFRFDLATALGRGERGFDVNSGFFTALLQDPVLTDVKLIAEPWDIGPGGYRLGGFPPGFAEWNDGFRDTVRRFWRGPSRGAQELAERMLGSAGLFDRAGRRSWSSVNFVACHDGFTLYDLVSYNKKHNLANGENDRDGHHENLSNNCGVEGASDDPEVTHCRAVRRRNLMATVLLSQGTPMLLAGDEIGNTQGGNNNAYCQDNEVGWINWSTADEEFLAFTRDLITLRKTHPCLHQGLFLHGRHRLSDGLPDVSWRSFDGSRVNWKDPHLDSFCLLLRESAEAPVYSCNGDAAMLAFNGSDIDLLAKLPPAPEGKTWRRSLDTVDPQPESKVTNILVSQPVSARSIVVFTLGPDA